MHVSVTNINLKKETVRTTPSYCIERNNQGNGILIQKQSNQEQWCSPIPLKLGPDFNSPRTPVVSSNYPVQFILQVPLIERFDVESVSRGKCGGHGVGWCSSVCSVTRGVTRVCGRTRTASLNEYTADDGLATRSLKLANGHYQVSAVSRRVSATYITPARSSPCSSTSQSNSCLLGNLVSDSKSYESVSLTLLAMRYARNEHTACSTA